MKTKQIIIVSACALAVFIAGLAIGYCVPKHHGPRGFHHREMMCDKCDCKGDPANCTCDKDCPCKGKMMKGDKMGSRDGKPCMKEGCDGGKGPRMRGPKGQRPEGPMGPRPDMPNPDGMQDIDTLASMGDDIQVDGQPKSPNNP